MQFQVSTDYAIRIVYYLSKHPDDLPTAMTIAEKMGITYPFFIKVANRLKQRGLINAVQGRNGGYYLGRSPEKISLYDIVMIMEGDLKINKCLEVDGTCSMDCIGRCPVYDVFLNVQAELIKMLSSVYVSDLN